MASKKERTAQDVARAVGAGKAVALDTVDFSDPNRPKTCLEVDFPILPVNQVAIIEGNAGKPIYQMSKWWARRRSSVFRSMLIAAAAKAPDDHSHAAKLVWENYYANHQKKGAFKHLKVADIFMGGGTTLVEGSRLGMQMVGNDLNPVAWFVVKQEFANVDLDEVKRLLADIEAEVKPQIMPYYYCDGPNGEKGTWTDLRTGETKATPFDPLTIPQDERKHYRYEGPEIIYTFWAKHGPCQVTGCGHRTPIMTTPIIAMKTLTVKHWPHTCTKCGGDFDIEEAVARMAPDVPLYIVPGGTAFSVLDPKRGVVCPHCGHAEMLKLGRPKKPNKKVELSLLVHPQWLDGSAKNDANGQTFGGSAQDDAMSTALWSRERARKIRLLEVRGTETRLVPDKKTGELRTQRVIPRAVTCPETGITFFTDARGGTAALKDKRNKATKQVELDEDGTPIKIPEDSTFSCRADGTRNGILAAIRATKKTGPMGSYAVQGFAPRATKRGNAYGGRFFAPFDDRHAAQYDAAHKEWEARKNSDLAPYWPTSEVPYGFMTHLNNGGIPNHGFTHWWTMFNPRQLLVHSQLLKAITTCGDFSWEAREYVLGAFQQYLRNQNSFCFWDLGYDKLVPHMSNNNYHPKSNIVENCVFSKLGRGNWASCIDGIVEGREWAAAPWEMVSVETLRRTNPELGAEFSGKSEKVNPGDPLLLATAFQGSSTELQLADQSIDLVVTDPPFGGLLHYSELSDFFYVWLRLVLAQKYPGAYGSEFTPKAMEAVSNRAREPEDPDGFYQRLLTQCWGEANRVLKPGGILAFTFHHSEDAPWVAVLESLFEAGFYLEATYPIRSDETKGEGAKPGTFGSQTIEYDIIHVCRKRTEEPKPVSWGRMRREVLADVEQLKTTLENHAKQGLPAADLQVIRRGKALEYFSRHYGKVYVDAERSISVKDALVGINQLINEDSGRSQEPPPVSAEPISRQFLRIFDNKTEVPRDQMQKHLRGSGIAPDEFVARDWCNDQHKVYHLVEPLAFAQAWYGKHRRKLTADLDQALVLTGACFDGSGINAADTLRNENFKPHPALKGLLDWLSRHAGTEPLRHAATRAVTIYNQWADSNKEVVQQMSLFLEE